MRSAFTLIELLVVIAIVAVLAIVVILVLNPAALLQQARDSNGLSDLATINSALGYYIEDASGNGTVSLGSASTTYISVPDPSATSTAGDQCQGLGLPPLPHGWIFHFATNSTFRAANGTGWMPVSFSSISVGSPIGQLPADPVNTTSSLLYYAYALSGGQYDLTSILESQKYLSVMATDGGSYAGLYQKGTVLDITPPFRSEGLVGYWPLDEGTGTTAYDFSGNGNNGTWHGTQAGTSGYYSAGDTDMWPYAGYFDGSTDYVATNAATSLVVGDVFTLSAWVKVTGSTNDSQVITYNAGGGMPSLQINSGYIRIVAGGVSQIGTSTVAIQDSNWHYIAWTKNGSTNAIYLDGTNVTGSLTNITMLSTVAQVYLGSTSFPGLIADARIYNRALSAAEIAAIYNAEETIKTRGRAFAKLPFAVAY
jgi:prepilin-type N-terminal cleavage/methylation domain-containing protein